MTQKEFNSEFSEYSYEDLDELIQLAGKRMKQMEGEPPDYDEIAYNKHLAQIKTNTDFIND